MTKLIFMLMFLVGCADTPARQFDSQDEQDASCYKQYGAKIGYCDRHYPRGK